MFMFTTCPGWFSFYFTSCFYISPQHSTRHHSIVHVTTTFCTSPRYYACHHNILQVTAIFYTSPQYSTRHHNILHFTTIFYTSPQYFTRHHNILHVTTILYTSPQYSTRHHNILQVTTILYTSPQYSTRHNNILHVTTIFYTSPQYSTLQHNILHFSTIFYTSAQYSTSYHNILHVTTIFYTPPQYSTRHHSHVHVYDMSRLVQFLFYKLLLRRQSFCFAQWTLNNDTQWQRANYNNTDLIQQYSVKTLPCSYPIRPSAAVSLPNTWNYLKNDIYIKTGNIRITGLRGAFYCRTKLIIIKYHECVSVFLYLFRAPLHCHMQHDWLLSHIFPHHPKHATIFDKIKCYRKNTYLDFLDKFCLKKFFFSEELSPTLFVMLMSLCKLSDFN